MPTGVRRSSTARALVALAAEKDLELTVHGNCMAPAITDGERLAVAAVTLPWPGDIVAALDEHGRIRVHRLLGYRPLLQGRRPSLALVTRADNERAIDSPVPLARLIGRVQRIGGNQVSIRRSERVAAVLAFLQGAANWASRRLRVRPGTGALP